MRAKRIVVGAALVLALGACGGREEGDDSNATAGLYLESQPDSCTSAEIDMASATAAGQPARCSGPWTFDKACCTTGNTLTACTHTHTVAAWTTTVPNVGGTTSCTNRCVASEQICGQIPLMSDPGISFVLPPCRWICTQWQQVCTTTYPACTAATSTVAAKLAEIQATWSGCKADPASWPTKPVPSVASVSGTGATCSVTFSNVPHDAASAPNKCDATVDPRVCGTPTYAACGAVGSSNPDGTTHTYVAPGACGFAEKLVSAKNLTRTELDAQAVRPIASPGYAAPFCTTCEDNNASADPAWSQVDGKLSCLVDTSLPAAQSWAAIHPESTYVAEVVQHAKLAYELYGDRASSGPRNAAAALYDSYPDVVPACGVATRFVPPASPTGCGPLGLVDGALTRCDRLTSSHAPEALAVIEAKGCIDARSRITGLPAACSVTQRYLDGGGTSVAYTGISTAILEKAFRTFTATGAARVPELQKRLALVDRWYRGVGGPTSAADGTFDAYAGADAAARKWRDTGYVTSALWRSFLAPDLASFTSTGRTEVDIANYLTNGMARDREMLEAMFTAAVPPWGGAATPPLRTAPALFVLSDALTTLTTRLDQMAAFHDLGCRFKDCVTLRPRTEALALQEIVGSLASDTGLSTAIAGGVAARTDPLNASYFSGNWDLWKPTFDRLAAGHAQVIQGGFKSAKGLATGAAYDPAWLSGIAPGDPLPLVTIGALVRKAGAHVANYRSGGLFLSEGAKSLPIGLLGSKIDAVSFAIDDSKNRFSTYRAAYNADRAALVNGMLGDLSAAATQNALLARWAQLEKRQRELAVDDTGLVISATLEQARFSSAAQVLKDVTRVTDALGVQYVRVKTDLTADQQHVSIEGSDAKASSAAWTSISSVALQRGGAPWKLSARPGQIVTFSMGSTTYAPTCALNRAYGGGVGFLSKPVVTKSGRTDLREAQTGPGGFNFAYSDGNFVTDSSSSADSHSVYASVEACFKTETPGGGIFGTDFSLKACAGASWSSTDTDTYSSGTEQRSSASFAMGLRLPGTPFPRFPAGALVAVLLPAGSTTRSEMVGAHVIQAPVTSISITKATAAFPDTDVYLVVNDVACGQAGAGAITADVTVVEPLATKMEQMVSAMQATVDSLASQADAIVAQGRLLPSQTRDFKNLAWTRVTTNCGCDPTTYPAAIYGYFDQWLDTQVLSIERRIERATIAREMSALSLEADALARDLTSNGTQIRLQSLLPQWSLRALNLGNEDMRAAAATMASLTSEALYPMMHLRYPEALTGLARPDDLLRLDWASATPDALDVTVRSLVDEIKPRLQSAVNASFVDDGSGVRKLPTALAAVRFLRPGAVVNWPVTPPGRVVTDGRATTLWDRLDENVARLAAAPPLPPLPVNLEIRLEDLYQGGSANTLLGCYAMAPAVKRMGYYVTTRDTNFDPAVYNGDIRVPSHGPREMLFPTPAGLELFTFDPEVATNSRVPLRYANPGSVLSDFAMPGYLGFYSEAQQGISPFGGWQLEIGGYEGNPFGALADEFVIIMELETRPTNPVTGVETCMP